MNKVILMGRLTRDPDIRYSQGENATAVARYTLAVDRRFRRDGEQRDAYLKRVKNDPIARKVKLADLTHNSDLSRIPDPKEKDIRRRENYLKEMEYLSE